MKRLTIVLMVMALLAGVLLIEGRACSAEGEPSIVTAKWLLENKDTSRLVIVDIRKVDEYREGHIPGSVNLTYNAWRTTEKGISCQLPLKEDIEEDL